MCRNKGVNLTLVDLRIRNDPDERPDSCCGTIVSKAAAENSGAWPLDDICDLGRLNLKQVLAI
jgi:hypothetical protein